MQRQIQERKSTGPLFAYIDLLFLLICFFILLLYLAGRETESQQNEISIITQQLAETTQEYTLAQKTIGQLKPLAEAALTIMKQKERAKQEEHARMERYHTKPIKRVTYHVDKKGNVLYQGQTYTPQEMYEQVVVQLRKEYWVALRSYSPENIPFGRVIHVRQVLLQKRGEFDTFWSTIQSQ